jgi:CRP-like cAMP-binding protein
MRSNYYEAIYDYMEGLIKDKITAEDKEKLKEAFLLRKVNKKELFLRAGEIPDCIAFTISGLLRCYYIDLKGNDVTKYFCFENSMISYLGLVLRKESSYYVEALEDSLLLCCDYASFDRLIHESNFGTKAIRMLLEQSLLYKEERESSFLLESATKRYQNFINSFPNVEKRVNLGYIASYLGISQVSLSRIRNKLHII